MEQIFREDLIWLDETFEDKDQFFDKIGKRLYEKGKVKESFADGLKSREAVYPTGLKTESYEIAIPHTDVEHVREASISFVRFKETVLFSHMGEPEIQVNAKFAFVLGVKEPSQQVEVLSTLVLLISNEAEMAKLEVLNSPAQICALLNEFFNEHMQKGLN